MAAEIVGQIVRSGKERAMRFNEAAANGRGNRAPCVKTATSTACFNEAAANGRGNPGGSRRAWRSGRASMRPRRMAAEIPQHDSSHAGEESASMRPRRMAAEIIFDVSRRRVV